MDRGRFFYTQIAAFAELESDLISERVREGMAYAKKKGKRISRPPLPESTQQKIHSLGKEKMSLRKIAAEVGVSHATVRNYLTES